MASGNIGMNLDKLVSDYEFQNHQHMKLIEHEEYLLSALESELVDIEEDIKRLTHTSTELDNNTRLCQRQFSLNRDNTDSLKKTYQVLNEHVEAMTTKRDLTLSKIKLEMEGNDAYLLAYEATWQKYKLVYESMPLAQELKHQKHINEGIEKQLKEKEEYIKAMQLKIHQVKGGSDLCKISTTDFIVKLAKLRLENLSLTQELGQMEDERKKIKEVTENQSVNDSDLLNVAQLSDMKIQDSDDVLDVPSTMEESASCVNMETLDKSFTTNKKLETTSNACVTENLRPQEVKKLQDVNQIPTSTPHPGIAEPTLSARPFLQTSSVRHSSPVLYPAAGNRPIQVQGGPQVRPHGSVKIPSPALSISSVSHYPASKQLTATIHRPLSVQCPIQTRRQFPVQQPVTNKYPVSINRPAQVRSPDATLHQNVTQRSGATPLPEASQSTIVAPHQELTQRLNATQRPSAPQRPNIQRPVVMQRPATTPPVPQPFPKHPPRSSGHAYTPPLVLPVQKQQSNLQHHRTSPSLKRNEVLPVSSPPEQNRQTSPSQVNFSCQSATETVCSKSPACSKSPDDTRPTVTGDAVVSPTKVELGKKIIQPDGCTTYFLPMKKSPSKEHKDTSSQENLKSPIDPQKQRKIMVDLMSKSPGVPDNYLAPLKRPFTEVDGSHQKNENASIPLFGMSPAHGSKILNTGDADSGKITDNAHNKSEQGAIQAKKHEDSAFSLFPSFSDSQDNQESAGFGGMFNFGSMSDNTGTDSPFKFPMFDPNNEREKNDDGNFSFNFGQNSKDRTEDGSLEGNKDTAGFGSMFNFGGMPENSGTDSPFKFPMFDQNNDTDNNDGSFSFNFGQNSNSGNEDNTVEGNNNIMSFFGDGGNQSYDDQNRFAIDFGNSNFKSPPQSFSLFK